MNFDRRRGGKLSLVLSSCLLLLLASPEKSLAGAWTLKKGQLWLKTSLLHQETSERYYSASLPCPLEVDCRKNGQRVPFPFGGESSVKAFYLDINYGLTDQLELQLQLPFFDIAFTDLSNPERPKSSEIGDVRFGARYRLLLNPMVTTIKVQAKAPTGFFNKEAEVVPVGDGQWDLAFAAQLGKSLWPISAYLNLDAGYRFRFAPQISTSDRDPGNEFFFRAEAGYNALSTLLLKLALNGLYGDTFVQSGVDILDSQREVLTLEPGIFWTAFDSFGLEASVQFSLAGKNFPAGEIYSFGAFYTFNLFQ